MSSNQIDGNENKRDVISHLLIRAKFDFPFLMFIPQGPRRAAFHSELPFKTHLFL